MKKKLQLLILLAVIVAGIFGCTGGSVSLNRPFEKTEATVAGENIDLDSIPAYSGEPYVVLNGNEPSFSEEDKETEAFEEYSPLDDLDRCGAAYAKLGKELMPTAERESISEVKPSGWVHKEYKNVEGRSLYNRCHLIGFQLAGENANERNLITGTRYLNTIGMLPFENQIADYIRKYNHHVMYRVTPIFEGDNLVASGVHMEAESVEDNRIQFNIYCYNNQPGIVIDYATGDSHKGNPVAGNHKEGSDHDKAVQSAMSAKAQDYVLNVNRKKFHKPDCKSVRDMSKKNKETCHCTREELIQKGYEPCGNCNP